MDKIVTCAICGKKFSTIGIAHHIKTHKISFKQYYDNYLRKDNEGYCKTCNKPTEFINLTYGYKNHCCRACIYKDKNTKNKRQQTNIKKYNTKHYTNREKAFETTKKNGMYRTKLEDRYLDRLKKAYPDIIQHYTSEKYPFECDFYIPSKELYIELNVFYLHGGHFFDEKNPEDIDKLNDWKSRDIDTAVWTVKDLIKRDFAIRNKLNYVVLWSEKELNDFIDGKFELVDTSVSIPDLIIDPNNKNQCQICGIIHENISGHVRNFHKMSTKEYYDKYLKQPGEGICPTCGKPTVFKGLTKGGYRKHCSTKCSTLDPNVQEKLKDTNLRKYGVENPFQAEEVKEVIRNKARQTKLNKPKKVYISNMSEEKKKFEVENNCTERNTLIAKYGYGWYQAKIIKPIYATINGIRVSFYKNNDIQKIEEYYNR